jgi:hypothetical protein
MRRNADHYEVESWGQRQHETLYSEAWREVGRRQQRGDPVRLFAVYADGTQAEIDTKPLDAILGV